MDADPCRKEWTEVRKGFLDIIAGLQVCEQSVKLFMWSIQVVSCLKRIESKTVTKINSHQERFHCVYCTLGSLKFHVLGVCSLGFNVMCMKDFYLQIIIILKGDSYLYISMYISFVNVEAKRIFLWNTEGWSVFFLFAPYCPHDLVERTSFF